MMNLVSKAGQIGQQTNRSQIANKEIEDQYKNLVHSSRLNLVPAELGLFHQNCDERSEIGHTKCWQVYIENDVVPVWSAKQTGNPTGSTLVREVIRGNYICVNLF